MEEALSAGRRAHERGEWRAAFESLSLADRENPLSPEDLERLAISAFLVGEEEVCVSVTARAHHECLQLEDAPRAARCAFWMAFSLLLRGELAPAAGWVSRGLQLLDEGHHDCVERGMLLVPTALRHLISGDASGALRIFSDALAIGERFGDQDLIAFGRLGRGQALVFSGRQQEGVDEFDLVMAGVTAGQVSAVLAGVAYCTVIEMCQMIFDVRRAKEWTAALTRWCAAQPDLVPFRGQCLVHRAEILQFNGDWTDAMEEARRACEQLSRPPGHPAIGSALYRVAELQRLRGDAAGAERTYGAASEHGRDPQPGLALLRLAQGRPADAASAIRRAVEEAGDPITRSHLLAAFVEVMLATRDVGSARAAAEELDAIASAADVPVLRATSASSMGSVRLAEGEPHAALTLLRTAWTTWRNLEAPYEAAKVRVAVGTACRQLGDHDGATLELQAAARVFGELGAVDDLATVEALIRPSTQRAHSLSPRERQVLALLATGMTNRAIAGELVVSEKTAARHVANIFTKLGVSSRSAATAYAYEHGLTQHTYTQ